ncbi:hypothetical protein QE364_003181 [Nocardioides zeae]|uniref:Uncharacterized protein n=1 Tax=Nocardioides zeae TaxID=1457234 RepID=A0ACC6IL38_9ACTN|nr:hypothetical protein [Nocardioides zeae]MDR6173988.1 hypothetical protein [Nocardioides zeae]MDR6211457.1 hypothetical protein [Nocardioides zeae]
MFDHLSPRGLLDAAAEAVRARRLAEVADLEVIAAWAAVHSGESAGPVRRRNPLVSVGGDGTPRVQDHALGEIALARSSGVVATINALADVLDLQHRLPLTWAVVRQGTAEVYVARKVARMSRHLPVAVVGMVDVAVARMIATEAPGRVLTVAEGKVIEADPALHEERVEEEKRRRYVGLGRTDEYGLRTLIARLDAGDAAWVQATVTRVAEILTPGHPDATADEVRAIALGYLARPAELLALLVEHEAAAPTGTAAPTETAETADPVQAGPVTDDEPLAPSRATALPVDVLDKLHRTDLTKLRPKAVLYVHLHEATLLGSQGVARVEELGPRTLGALQQLLASTRVTVKPVIDLADAVRTTAYEHPEAIKERVHLITGGDYWPYATSTSRNADYDHPTPFDPSTNNQQTGTHNSGLLQRRHHRWKTHAGYQARQRAPGHYVWLTPNGLGFTVDPTGTHPCSENEARLMLAFARRYG